MRYYINLNENKSKDKLIIDYLEKQYNAKDFITQLLYQYATNCTDLHQFAPINTKIDNPIVQEGVQNSPSCTETEQTVQVKNIELTDDIRKYF